MPRRRDIVTQYEITRAARAAAKLSPPYCVQVLRDGSLVLIPVAVVAATLAPPPASPIPADC
jgi:hypothetical protein